MANDFINQINGPDLNTMINLSEFGEPVIYTADGLPPISISALFQEPTAVAETGLDVEAISNYPTVIVRSIDVTWKIDPSDRIVIRGKDFKVVDFIDEKYGTIEIYLQRV